MPGSAPQLRRIGLFGGTFDPPHVGHLVTAVNVRHALDLDLVVLMVASVPWQKEGTRVITPALDRLAMVEAAVCDVTGLVPGRTEIDLGYVWEQERAGGPRPMLAVSDTERSACAAAIACSCIL